jgi:hypothetical protein
VANQKSNYLASKIYNHVLRGVVYTPPAGVYLALFSSLTNGDTSTFVELVGNAYARQAVTFGADTNGIGTNNALASFPLATAPWAAIVGVGLMDAATGGNLLYFGELLPNKTLGTGERIEFPVGSVTVREE